MKLLLTLLLILVVLISAVEIVVAQHQLRKLFIEITELEKTRDELNEEWGRLQLEQSTWATDVRVERIARTELSMMEPGTGSLILLVQ